MNLDEMVRRCRSYRRFRQSRAVSLETLRQLVGVLGRAGRAPEAEARIRESALAMRRVYPAGNFHLALQESMLGANLVSQGRRAEAEPLLRSSHQVILSQAASESDFFVLDSYLRVLQLYDGWRPRSAEPYRDAFARRVASSKEGAGWQIARMALGPAEARIEDGLDRLQQITGDVSFPATAGRAHSPGLAAVLEVLTAALGEAHANTREARAQLFALYTALGKPEQAAAYAPAG